MLKLIITDDHRIFNQSLSKLLSRKKVAEVLAEATSGEELIDMLDTHTPDVILMDIALPGMNGIEATKEVLKKQPNAKVLCLSAFGDEKYYYSMVEAGAKGFVLKTADFNELHSALTEIASGRNYFSAELLHSIIESININQNKKQHVELTERETEIIRLVCQSYTNEQIAQKLFISTETVKWHRANLLTKTGSTNTASLVIFAIRNNIFKL